MDCRLQHLGIWLVEDRWFLSAIEAVRAGVLKPAAQEGNGAGGGEDGEFAIGPNGMAILDVAGPLTKGRSSFGGTSTVALRRTLRRLAADDAVSGILLRVESPGGTAEGTHELAEEVAAAAERKPVRAHIEDLGASAAFWVASQADSITANPTAEVGSIGTVAVLVDSSKAADMQGLRVHVLSTGVHKGAGVPGAEVSEEQLAVFRERIDDINAFFLEGVQRGRGFDGGALARAATGRVWIAEKARNLGLIDGIMSLENAIGHFAIELTPARGSPAVLTRRQALEAAEIECAALEPIAQERRPPTSVQTLVFSKEKFNRAQAKKWARDHDFRDDKVDETEDSWRLRQFEPSECRVGSFRTIELEDGVQAVICRKRAR